MASYTSKPPDEDGNCPCPDPETTETESFSYSYRVGESLTNGGMLEVFVEFDHYHSDLVDLDQSVQIGGIQSNGNPLWPINTTTGAPVYWSGSMYTVGNERVSASQGTGEYTITFERNINPGGTADWNTFRTLKVDEGPGAEQIDVTETLYDDADGSTVVSTRTDRFIYTLNDGDSDDTWDLGEDWTWELRKAVGQSFETREVLQERPYNPAETGYTGYDDLVWQRRTLKNANDVVVSTVEEVLRDFRGDDEPEVMCRVTFPGSPGVGSTPWADYESSGRPDFSASRFDDALVELYGYYNEDDDSEVTSDYHVLHGSLKWMVDSSGDWAYYEKDDEGRVTRRIYQLDDEEVFGSASDWDTQGERDTNAGNNISEVMEYDLYEDLERGSGDDSFPAVEVTKHQIIEGSSTVRRTWYKLDWPAAYNGETEADDLWMEDWEVTLLEPDVASSDVSSLRAVVDDVEDYDDTGTPSTVVSDVASVVRTFRYKGGTEISDTNLASQAKTVDVSHQLARRIGADGMKTRYDYPAGFDGRATLKTEGYGEPMSRRWTMKAGDGTLVAELTEQRNTSASASSWFTAAFNAYNAWNDSDWYPTVAKVAYARDEEGEVIEWVHFEGSDAASEFLNAAEYYTASGEGDDASSDITTTNAVYWTQLEQADCGCGVSVRVDRASSGGFADGFRTEYGYDALRRNFYMEEVAQEDTMIITTTRSFDAAGRVVSESVQGDSGPALTTDYDYDDAGRVVMTINPAGEYAFTTYRKIALGSGGEPSVASGQADTYDPDSHSHGFWLETRMYPHDEASGPVSVTWTDSRGRVRRSWSAKPGQGVTWGPSVVPTAGLSLVEVARTAYEYDWSGRQVGTRQYHDLSGLGLADAGTLGSHYHESTSRYDALGRMLFSEDAAGTMTGYTYDAGGRLTGMWVGTDDGTDGFTAGNPGAPSSGGDMVRVQATYYDDNGAAVGGTPLAYAGETRTLEPGSDVVDPLPASIKLVRESLSSGSREARLGGDGVWRVSEADLEGRVIASRVYSDDADALFEPGGNDTLLSQSTSTYHARTGVLMFQQACSVVGGVVQTTPSPRQTDYYYDVAGRQVLVVQPSLAFAETVYDALGRVEKSLVGYLVNYSAMTPTSDPFTLPTIGDRRYISEQVLTYDDAGRVVGVETYTLANADQPPSDSKKPDEADAGLYRLSRRATYYDMSGRVTHEAEWAAIPNPAQP